MSTILKNVLQYSISFSNFYSLSPIILSLREIHVAIVECQIDLTNILNMEV